MEPTFLTVIDFFRFNNYSCTMETTWRIEKEKLDKLTLTIFTDFQNSCAKLILLSKRHSMEYNYYTYAVNNCE